MAQHWQVNVLLLEEILDKITTEWLLFSKEEFLSSINKCNNDLTPGPNRLSWRYLKVIIKNLTYLSNIINIANMCIELEHWLSHFKMFIPIIIPKLNKASYDIPKKFRPIVLLNTLGKLIEKAISERLQFQALSKNTIYPCQLGELKQCSITDAGIVLTYLIYVDWVKNHSTSTLAFDIV